MDFIQSQMPCRHQNIFKYARNQRMWNSWVHLEKTVGELESNWWNFCRSSSETKPSSLLHSDVYFTHPSSSGGNFIPGAEREMIFLHAGCPPVPADESGLMCSVEVQEGHVECVSQPSMIQERFSY